MSSEAGRAWAYSPPPRGNPGDNPFRICFRDFQQCSYSDSIFSLRYVINVGARYTTRRLLIRLTPPAGGSRKAQPLGGSCPPGGQGPPGGQLPPWPKPRFLHNFIAPFCSSPRGAGAPLARPTFFAQLRRWMFSPPRGAGAPRAGPVSGERITPELHFFGLVFVPRVSPKKKLFPGYVPICF